MSAANRGLRSRAVKHLKIIFPCAAGSRAEAPSSPILVCRDEKQRSAQKKFLCRAYGARTLLYLSQRYRAGLNNFALRACNGENRSIIFFAALRTAFSFCELSTSTTST